ncbi:TrkH-domain-containing protein [Backusella circina FSU 941]|nr:TrkH-domain-containing protein [Backusella circina FSU 941]
MATTGSTDTGLNTIAMSDMGTYHMVILMMDSFLGSHVIISFGVVMVRRYYFSKRFEKELLVNNQRREEYKRKRLEQQQNELNMMNDDKSSKLSSSIIIKPLRRRMSLLSTRSTPVHNTNDLRISFFSKKRRGSLDTHATRLDASPFTTSLYKCNTDQSDQTTHDVQQGEAENGENEKNEGDYSIIEMDHFGASSENHLAHPYDGSLKDDDSFKSTGRDTDDGYLDIMLSTDDKENLDDVVDKEQLEEKKQQQQQQITFTPDTNVLRERERQKLIKIRNDPTLESVYEHNIQRTNTEYDTIMTAPVNKKDLTKNERYRIGGTEYRALDLLAYIVPLSYVCILISFGFFFRIYVACSSYAREVLATSNPTGPVDAWFFSFFMSVSSFTNLGLNHLDASMSPFQNAPAPLIFSIILILVGNTAYAIMLRFLIWFFYTLTPKSQVMRREAFRYLLDHPRRCFTTLFPASQTWWLLIVLIAITLFELLCFLSLNYWLPVLDGISWGSRILDGVFQSVATRNAGFSVVSLADLNPATQLVYIVAMYISVYPVAISMRNSNVYQERALGIFRGDNEEPVSFSEKDLQSAPFIKLTRHATISSMVTTSKKILKGPDFFVITQIQKQLTSDICWVITGVFLICILEAQSIMSPSPVTIATVIYECVSAFGNVGASTGYPNTATSQAGQYRTLSKLVLIALMYRGRHRGLPASIDRSILLPSDSLAEKEREDELRRRAASVSQSNSDSGPESALYFTTSRV